MICPNCGSQNPEGINFCQSCGVNLEKTQQPPTPSTMPPPTTPTPSPKPIKKILLIFLAFLLALGAGIGIFFFQDRIPFLASFPTDFKGLRPGDTKEKVLQVLGQAVDIKTETEGEIWEYPSDNEIISHHVFLKNNQVEAISVHVEKNQKLKLTAAKTKFGKPEAEMFSNYSAWTKVYIFPKKGVSVIADPKKNLVFEILYFAPTTLENYLATFGQGLLETNPYTH